MNTEILKHPDPDLRKISEPVSDEEFDTMELKEIVTLMTNVMMKNGGIGLAAPQIGINKRIFIRICQKEGGIKAYFNPSWKKLDDNMFAFKEGCLSVPGLFGVVRRPMNIKITAKDIHGVEFTEEVSRLESTCIQHEIDHLDGIEFIDYLSEYQKKKILIGMNKMRIQNPSEYSLLKKVLMDSEEKEKVNESANI